MNIQEAYDEWKGLVKESRRVAARKRELKRILKTPTFKERVFKISKHRKSRYPNRDVEIVSLYKEGKTLQEVGDLYGITRERVRQILKWEDITRNDGGASLKPKQSELPCKVDGCERLANGSKGYCTKHYARVQVHGTPSPKFMREFQENGGGCLVDGCDKPFKAYGLCNKHSVNYFLNKKRGNVKDLNDFLEVQKAKQLMGKRRAYFSEIREFMNSH